MGTGQETTLKKRIDRLKDENKKLKDKLMTLRKAHQSLQRDLKNSRKLLNNIPGGVVLIQDGEVLFINETSLERLGYTKEEIHNRNFLEFIHPASRESMAEQYMKRLSGKPVPNQYETYLVTKNGETLCCDIRVNKFMYQGRRAFVLNVVGVDERKKKERELVRSRKMEAVVCMASGLNQRLNSCLAMLEGQFRYFQVMESLGERGMVRMLGKVEATKEVGRHIMEQLNCLSKAKYEPSDMKRIDLKKAVRRAVSITRPKWDENPQGAKGGINVRTYLRNVSPIQAHSEDLQAALASIILNAVDAMPRGGEIHVTTEEVPGFAHVYIQDNGIGISQEIRDRIFDPFFTTRGGEGNGLGLSLAYRIIKRHGGDIEVISQEGEGSTFDIKLPLARNISPPGVEDKKNRIRDARILIIADDGLVKDLLYYLFKGKGGKVKATFGVPEALKVLKKSRFDLVVVDFHNLPAEPRIIIQKIKEIGKGLPIMTIKPQGAKKPPRSFENNEIDLVIGLPLDMDRIPRLISRILSNSESAK